MSILLRVALCMTGVLFVLYVLKVIISRKMTERQSILWILGGIIIIMFGLFPSLVFFISDLFSVQYAPSIIFTIAALIAIYGIFNCYKTNTELSARVQELAMQVSLLKEENERLKKSDEIQLTKQENNEEKGIKTE